MTIYEGNDNNWRSMSAAKLFLMWLKTNVGAFHQMEAWGVVIPLIDVRYVKELANASPIFKNKDMKHQTTCYTNIRSLNVITANILYNIYLKEEVERYLPQLWHTNFTSFINHSSHPSPSRLECLTYVGTLVGLKITAIQPRNWKLLCVNVRFRGRKLNVRKIPPNTDREA